MIVAPAAPPPAVSQIDATSGSAETPQWIVKPTLADVAKVYPAQAKAEGIGGMGEVACVVGADQTLTGCVLVNEQPQRTGFATATLALTPMFRIQPPSRRGVPVATRINIPLRFDPPAPAVGETPVAPRVGWAHAPTPLEVAAAYPKAAREKGVAGLGVMRCMVRSGALTACVAATADADGFSRAATRLAAKFTLEPTYAVGNSTEGLILNVPVRFTPELSGKGRSPVLAAPQWVQQPSSDQLAASFPAVARVQGLAKVRVVQSCRIGADGGLGSCRTKSEEPVGVGGAQAAARLMDAYRVSPWSYEGVSAVGATVDVPVVLAPAG